MKSEILFHVHCPRNFFHLCELYLTGILKLTQSPFQSTTQDILDEFGFKANLLLGDT